MQKVYFKRVDSYRKTAEISNAARELIERLVADDSLVLAPFVPFKVTFGEQGNTTFITPENFAGLLDFLKEKQIDSAYLETNVLYRGQRTTSENHVRLAREHGFTQLPVLIADGDHGERFENVVIDQKHFRECKIGSEIAKQKQMIVLSHFKGHILAGYGGAIKQLAMGCASRGGKLAQHDDTVPKISRLKCKSCGACARYCPENAIELTPRAKILKNKCVGCASCMTVCPYHAISHTYLASLSRAFLERLAEYALAAAKGKTIIYVSYAFNITRGCDCEGHPMKPVANDLGVFASTDPVAIDQACHDLLDRVSRRRVFKRGRYTLAYAEKIGLGSREYELVEL